MQIKIKYLNKTLEPIKKLEIGDWIDLRASEDTIIKSGEHKLIPLGVCMKIPHGFEAHLLPRSSTFKNFGIIMANSMGIIDESYSGDNDQWMFSAYATRDTTIQFNDRICQFRIMPKQPEIEFEIVENMNSESRGGFGSTGVK